MRSANHAACRCHNSITVTALCFVDLGRVECVQERDYRWPRLEFEQLLESRPAISRRHLVGDILGCDQHDANLSAPTDKQFGQNQAAESSVETA